MLVVSAAPALVRVRVLDLSDAVTLSSNPTTLSDVLSGCHLVTPAEVSCLPTEITERRCCLVYNAMEKIICLGQKGKKEYSCPSKHSLGLNLQEFVLKVNHLTGLIDVIIASSCDALTVIKQ